MIPGHSPHNFAERLNFACDNHDECPELHRGRLVWIRDQFNKDSPKPVSLEGVRKWVAGEVWPRRNKLLKLAEILRVDVVWLETGSGINTREIKSDPKEIPLATVEPLLEVQIRPDKVVTITGLPLDLSEREAKRVANVIMAHAAVD